MGPTDSRLVYELNRKDGSKLRQFELSSPTKPTWSLQGALLAINGFLYYGDGTASRRVLRYKLATGEFDVDFPVPITISKMAFDGQDMCVGDDSSKLYCFQILDRNVYHGPGGDHVVEAQPPLLIGTTLVDDVVNGLLSELVQPDRRLEWRLCYSGVRDGFDAATFHRLCNNRGASLTIARVGAGPSSGRVFGGYGAMPWSSRNGYATGREGWLFRVTSSGTVERTDQLRYGGNICRYTNCDAQVMYDHPYYCPTFGAGFDLHIDGTCKTGYTTPGTFGYSLGGYSDTWLAGSYNAWTLDSLEVFVRADALPDACDNVVCPAPKSCQLPGVCVEGLCEYTAAPDDTPCDDQKEATAFDTW